MTASTKLNKGFRLSFLWIISFFSTNVLHGQARIEAISQPDGEKKWKQQQQQQHQHVQGQREALIASNHKHTKQFVMSNNNNNVNTAANIGGLYRPLQSPELLWSVRVAPVLDDNGVYISPDDSLLVSTSGNGNVYAFSPQTGEELWVYTPPRDEETSVQCYSGVSFAYNGPQQYLVYSIVDYRASFDSYDTRVIALDPAGNELWQSLALEGVGAGTPVASLDGSYVFLTHNSHQGTVGHFTMLSPLRSDVLGTIYPLYTEFNRTNPFSPPGIYHYPRTGNYPGGELNSNDIVAWSFAPRPDESNTNTAQSRASDNDSSGSIFIFQLPLFYPDRGELFYRKFSEHIDWKSISPPVLTDEGRSLYWAASGSRFVAWLEGDRYHEESTASATFDRGNPLNQACFNTPALTSDSLQPRVFAGTASRQFVKMDHRLTTLMIQPTESLVRAPAKVTPNDEYVIYTEYRGVVHIAQSSNLRDFASYNRFGNLGGEFAMSSYGDTLYVGDETGNIQALRIAHVPTAAPSPTFPPITLSFTAPPARVPTLQPTFEPTIESTSNSTISTTEASSINTTIDTTIDFFDNFTTEAPSNETTFVPTDTVAPTINDTVLSDNRTSEATSLMFALSPYGNVCHFVLLTASLLLSSWLL